MATGALEREVLALYAQRAAIDLDRLKAAAAGAARREAAHLIVGSARAIGAGRVARLAAAWKRRGRTRATLANWKRAVAEARSFVADYLARVGPVPKPAPVLLLRPAQGNVTLGAKYVRVEVGDPLAAAR